MIGIIGGTGVYEITDQAHDVEKKVLKTPYGDSPEISLFKLHDRNIAFIPRHAEGHDYPPHMINYRANIWALEKNRCETNNCHQCRGISSKIYWTW